MSILMNCTQSSVHGLTVLVIAITGDSILNFSIFWRQTGKVTVTSFCTAQFCNRRFDK